MDLEWNQPFGGVKLVQKPVILHGEIIQIGAIKTDEGFNLVDKIKLSVRPKYYKKMNPHVEKITGITSQSLMMGEQFPQAFKRFSDWCGEEFRFITWGFDDVGVLADNLTLHGLDASFGRDYINLQLIYNRQVNNEQLQYSLSTAAESLGIPIDVKVHDALNDALLTFGVCRKLDMGLGIAEYAAYSAGIPTPVFKDTLFKIDMKHVLDNGQAMDIKCPACRKERNVDCRLKFAGWLFNNGKSCRTIGRCGECGGIYSVRLKGVKVSEGNYTLVRSIFEATEEDAAAFAEKLRKREERKRKNAEKKAAEQNLKAEQKKEGDNHAENSAV